ncbi:putative ABC transporter permease [Candidatus Saccharibacteria bacterium]|nr:putative ABC transporter permease [Candidatus Saccharibacteria bacterium]MBR3323662.1 putative ABC transporter permease [Candidatus Saccharibacteria bacterium]
MDAEVWKVMATWFLYYVFYSVAGYLLELTHLTNPKKAFENRGFLFGPYCPIYGLGAIIIIAATKEVSMNPIFTYFISMFVCTTLEYITSFLMEKIFNMRWWDYSKMPYNLNGRICLKNSLLFGIGGMVIVYMTQPVVGNIVGGLDNAWLATLAIVSAVILIVDFVFSTIASYKVKNFVNDLYKDSTSHIKKLAKDYYTQRKEKVKKAISALEKH